MWKLLLSLRPLAEKHIYWIVGKADSSLWSDRWLLDADLIWPPNCSLNSVKELFQKPYELSNAAASVLPESVRKAFSNQSIFLSQNEDSICWTVNSNGLFSITSAWNMVLQQNAYVASAKFVWHKLLPKQISLFLWKLCKSRLPIAEGLWKKGIQLAEKSFCRFTGNVETFNHVFLTSTVASAVWSQLCRTYAVKMNVNSVQQASFSWWFSTKVSLSHILIPSITMWELWKHRNCGAFEHTI